MNFVKVTNMTETGKVETDYHGRMSRVQDSAEKGEWFKPTPGKHKVKFLSEGTPYEVEWEGETIPKLRFDVEVKGKKFSWGITEGKTTASTYGQLMLIATKMEPINKMEGKEITLLAVSDGTKNTYTVLEAMDLIPQAPEVEEKKV